jgi:hypothetical protein
MQVKKEDKPIDVWVGCFSENGSDEPKEFLGEFEAKNLDEAVDKYLNQLPKSNDKSND